MRKKKWVTPSIEVVDIDETDFLAGPTAIPS